MYYSKKGPVDESEFAVTDIWACSNESCNGWMRDNFVFMGEPTCALCKAPMVKGQRKLAILDNTSPVQNRPTE